MFEVLLFYMSRVRKRVKGGGISTATAHDLIPEGRVSDDPTQAVTRKELLGRKELEGPELKIGDKPKTGIERFLRRWGIDWRKAGRA